MQHLKYLLIYFAFQLQTGKLKKKNNLTLPGGCCVSYIIEMEQKKKQL